ncbi:MAG: hypothetical protein HQK54_15180, partial [Oligoflexales bacterium]|nr:hypothetical protein [Oligoflexales bacterium]
MVINKNFSCLSILVLFQVLVFSGCSEQKNVTSFRNPVATEKSSDVSKSPAAENPAGNPVPTENSNVSPADVEKKVVEEEKTSKATDDTKSQKTEAQKPPEAAAANTSYINENTSATEDGSSDTTKREPEPTPYPTPTPTPTCVPSQAIALVTKSDVTFDAAGLNITRLSLSDVEKDTKVLEQFDTIALEMVGAGNIALPKWAREKMDNGAKIVWFWNSATVSSASINEFGVTSAHFHPGTKINDPRIKFEKKGKSLVVDSFDPVSIGPLNMLQMYTNVIVNPLTGGEKLCGTISYDDYLAGGNKGSFHGYLKD